MDYILFNSDGSINKEQTHLNQYIMQDENNKQIEIKVDGIEAPGNLVAELFCTLPNNQTVILMGSWSAERLGWIFTITGNVTLYSGIVLAAVRIRDQETEAVRVMFPFTLVINKTGIKPEDDTGVTLEELDGFLDLFKSWIGGGGLTVPTFDAQFEGEPEFEDFQLTPEDLNDIWENKYPLINIRVTIEDEQTIEYIICFKLSHNVDGAAMTYAMTSMEFSNDDNHQYDLDCMSFIIALDEETNLPAIVAVNEEYYTNRFDRLKNIPALPTNLENGTGTNAVRQKMADATVDFTGRNPNAIAADPSLAAEIPTGASGNQANAFGKNTMARATAATAMGNKCLADAEESLSQGYQCVTLRGADGAHAQGNETTSGGKCAHSEGLYTQAMADESHSEGNSTAAYAQWGHSEGVFTTVQGNYIITTHDVDPSPIPPEPVTPTPTPEELDALNGVGAHSEGHYNFSFGLGSHTEGHGNKGYARFSHAEGGSNQAGPDLVLRKTENGQDYYTINHEKQYQHAEGYYTKAIGTASHTGGWGTIAGYDYQTVIGQWNYNLPDTLFEVGNGTDVDHRSNAFEVHKDGRATIGAGPVNDLDVVNKKYFEDNLKTINGQPIHGTGNIQISPAQTGLWVHDMVLTNTTTHTGTHIRVINANSTPFSIANMNKFSDLMGSCIQVLIEEGGGAEQMALVTKSIYTAGTGSFTLVLTVAGTTYHTVTLSDIDSVFDDQPYPYN